MKKLIFCCLPLLFTVLFISAPLSAATRGISVVSKHGENLYLYKDYQALVIGVSNYERWPKLPNAAKDAIEVADSLRKMGVYVKLVLDPTYRELKTALTEMIYVMGREENRGILFYYAGHGETERLADGTKMGYIIPKDCPLLRVNPMGFANHAISMKEIESASMRIRSKHVLMLFDSCFSGALFALVRAVPHDITEKSALPVRQYITAGREDEEVPDQSMFKRCLLIGLEGDADLTGDGYITGSELGMYLSDKVVNYTNRQQHPQYGKINNPDLDRGDFIFSLNRSLASSETTPSISNTSENHRLAEERARLERERRELEEMRALIEERKRLDEERKRLEVEKKRYETAKLTSKPEKPLSVSGKLKAQEIARDGRFIAYDNGTVLDTKTKLMWAAKDDGNGLMEYDVEDYLEKYKVGGYTDWRLPTADELETIFDRGIENQYGYHITKLIYITGVWVWGSEWLNMGAFNFKNGSFNEIGKYGYRTDLGFVNHELRALPVRDAK